MEELDVYEIIVRVEKKILVWVLEFYSIKIWFDGAFFIFVIVRNVGN